MSEAFSLIYGTPSSNRVLSVAHGCTLSISLTWSLSAAVSHTTSSSEVIIQTLKIPLFKVLSISATGITISEYLSIFSHSAYEYIPFSASSTDNICHADIFLSVPVTLPIIISFSLALVIATYNTRSSSDMESRRIFLATAPFIIVEVLVCLSRLT